MRRTRLPALLMSLAWLALGGCAKSQGCQSDNDCKGDRICQSGQCAASPAKASTAGASEAPAPAMEPTDEEKLRDETLAIHEQVLEILKDNVDKPDQIVQVLHKFETESRGKRQRLKKAGLKRMGEMSDERRTSFIAENRKRHGELSERFASAVKKYPAGIQSGIKQLVALIAFN